MAKKAAKRPAKGKSKPAPKRASASRGGQAKRTTSKSAGKRPTARTAGRGAASKAKSGSKSKPASRSAARKPAISAKRTTRSKPNHSKAARSSARRPAQAAAPVQTTESMVRTPTVSTPEAGRGMEAAVEPVNISQTSQPTAGTTPPDEFDDNEFEDGMPDGEPSDMSAS